MPNAFCFIDRNSEIDIQHVTAIYPTIQMGDVQVIFLKILDR